MTRKILASIFFITLISTAGVLAINESHNPYYPAEPGNGWYLLERDSVRFNATTQLNEGLIFDHETSQHHQVFWSAKGCLKMRDGLVRPVEAPGSGPTSLEAVSDPNGWGCDLDWD